MEIKKIIVIFSITLLCNGKVMHNVNSLLKIILMSKQILGQDVSTAPGDADDAPSDRAFWREWVQWIELCFLLKKFITVVPHNPPIPLLSDDPGAPD